MFGVVGVCVVGVGVCGGGVGGVGGVRGSLGGVRCLRSKAPHFGMVYEGASKGVIGK